MACGESRRRHSRHRYGHVARQAIEARGPRRAHRPSVGGIGVAVQAGAAGSCARPGRGKTDQILLGHRREPAMSNKKILPLDHPACLAAVDLCRRLKAEMQSQTGWASQRRTGSEDSAGQAVWAVTTCETCMETKPGDQMQGAKWDSNFGYWVPRINGKIQCATCAKAAP